MELNVSSWNTEHVIQRGFEPTLEAYLHISRLFLQNEIGDLFGNLKTKKETINVKSRILKMKKRRMNEDFLMFFPNVTETV